MRRASSILCLLSVILLTGCLGEQSRRARVAIFVGIDVSGSFQRSGYYDDSLKFLSHYTYGHLYGLGHLSLPKALFVGSIGGESLEEPKSFRPIHEFQEKTIAEIEANLKGWFPKSDHITDFNIFFKQVASIVRKRNLSLTPIEIILLTDGIPAVPGARGEAIIGNFKKIDISPLEFLSRKVTVRLLYASPTAATKWETAIPRKRVRMWTVDGAVMTGWRSQLKQGAKPPEQEKLWTWIKDNVDYRVRPFRMKKGT